MDDQDALPLGHLVGDYRIERVLSRQRSGFDYLALDTGRQANVTLREQFPRYFADRAPDGIGVVSDELSGLALMLLSQAKRLLEAGLQHPNIVGIRDGFAANGTEYMVTDHLQGMTLGAILDRDGTIEESEVDEILYPLLDALAYLADRSIVHGGVEPDCIQISPDGTPVLLNFNHWVNEMADEESTAAFIVSPYAPIETDRFGAKLVSPASDIYGLAATLNRALFGERPQDPYSRFHAMEARRDDPMVPAVERGKGLARPALLAAIDHGLAVMPEDRPQSLAAFRDLIGPPADAT